MQPKSKMRLVAAAALVDGKLQAEEKPVLLRYARELGLEPADGKVLPPERAFVERVAGVLGVAPKTLAARLGAGAAEAPPPPPLPAESEAVASTDEPPAPPPSADSGEKRWKRVLPHKRARRASDEEIDGVRDRHRARVRRLAATGRHFPFGRYLLRVAGRDLGRWRRAAGDRDLADPVVCQDSACP